MLVTFISSDPEEHSVLDEKIEILGDDFAIVERIHYGDAYMISGSMDEECYVVSVLRDNFLNGKMAYSRIPEALKNKYRQG